jgi:hypothetical protein
MTQLTPRPDYGATRNFVLDDVQMPPAAVIETETLHVSDHETGSPLGAALIVTVAANIAMSLIIITAMILDGSKANRAIIAGGLYFLVSTITFSFVITGSLTAILGRWARETTERRRIDAYLELGERMLEWRMMQEQVPAVPRGPTAAMHRLSPLGDAPNYVTPYLEGEQAAVEGLRWAVGLYDASGQPDRRKVGADGRLLCRMIGSKRGGGSRESGLWLLRNGVIVRVRKGYALAVDRFPAVETVRRLL